MSTSNNSRGRSSRTEARKSKLKKNKSRKNVRDRRMTEKHDRLMEQFSAEQSETEVVTEEVLSNFGTLENGASGSDNKQTPNNYLSSFEDTVEADDKAVQRRGSSVERKKRLNKARNRRPWKFKLTFTLLMIAACISVMLGTVLLVKPEAIKEKVYDIQRWQYPKTYSNYVNAYAEKYDVDPDLVYAVIYTESHFDAEAGSPAGAVGLMQITPICFEFVKGELKEEDKDNYTLKDLTKPGVSIKYGTFFLGYLLKHYEKEETAVAAYNAGFSTVDIWLEDKAISPDGKSLQNIPYEETANYVVKVEDTKKKYKELY